MPKFTKRPVVIDAYQMLTESDARDGVCTGGATCKGRGPDGAFPHIHTLEGDFTWTPGDWVIRGVQGEYYFCKPDIFAATYEAVDSELCPGCDVLVTAKNAGDYKTYCETCVDAMPWSPFSVGGHIEGRYPNFTWVSESQC